MSLEINFIDRETYLSWRASWRILYKEQTKDIRNIKTAIKISNQEKASRLQRELHYERQNAQRMMKTLEEAKAISREARQTKVEQPQAA